MFLSLLNKSQNKIAPHRWTNLFFNKPPSKKEVHYFYFSRWKQVQCTTRHRGCFSTDYFVLTGITNCKFCVFTVKNNDMLCVSVFVCVCGCDSSGSEQRSASEMRCGAPRCNYKHLLQWQRSAPVTVLELECIAACCWWNCRVTVRNMNHHTCKSLTSTESYISDLGTTPVMPDQA